MSMKKIANSIHRIIINAAADTGLFIFVSFMVAFFSGMDPFLITRDELVLFKQYVFIPWGTALCIHRVQRAYSRNLKVRAEIWVLLVLWLWLVVPFAFRFGLTGRSVGGWNSYGVMFFAVYALISEEDRDRREATFDHVLICFAVLGWILGVSMLYCAVTVQSFTAEMGNYAYGVYNGMHLISGHYYNTTALIALYTTLMCLAGVSRSRRTISRLLYAVPAVMMGVVTILTQSRTSRYALLAALALGVYGVMCRILKGRHMLVRQAAAAALGIVLMISGYLGADWLTEKALIHYAADESDRTALTLIAPALADEATTESQTVDVGKLKRGFGDATFTGRTAIWKNAIQIWKETPRYMFIGVGNANSGKLLARGLPTFEQLGGIEAHNAYLQFAVDYGMIGAALLAAFMCLLIQPALRVFYQDDWRNGYGVMTLIVAAALLVGMMESDTFGALTFGGTMLFFALAMLASRGREMVQSGSKGSEE